MQLRSPALALLVIVGCTPPDYPPPPERPANTSIVTGQIRDDSGFSVPFADVVATAADASCRKTGIPVSVIADERGEFRIPLEAGVGPAFSGCVIVEAASGGASGRARAPAEFSSAADGQTPVVVNVRLTELDVLTATEAERLVRLLAQSINDPSSGAAAALRTYAPGNEESLRVAIEQYRSRLGSIVTVNAVEEESFTGDGRRTPVRFAFEMVDERGGTARVFVHQESLIRLHGLLLDYGWRSKAFMATFVRAITSRDAILLSRLLNPDDVDFPVERAEAMIASYHERFDPSTLRAELVDFDDRRHTITWRLHGRTPEHRETDEIIELITGDGLIGIKDL